MNYITTTQLRTDSTRLVAALRIGEKISLIHRSQIIGVISPPENKNKTIQSTEELSDFLRLISPQGKLTEGKREKTYRKHLTAKYG